MRQAKGTSSSESSKSDSSFTCFLAVSANLSSCQPARSKMKMKTVSSKFTPYKNKTYMSRDHEEIYKCHRNHNNRFLKMGDRSGPYYKLSAKKVLTFIIFTYIRLIIDNCHRSDSGGASLGANPHGFGHCALLDVISIC
jgi:hypothetical protein